MFSFLRRLNRAPNVHPAGFMTANSQRARQPGDRDRNAGRIHHVAVVGNVWRMKQILFFRPASLNERDPNSRTALHFACAYGHEEVVRLLVKRRCLLDICDVDNKTALIHAVQCQQEECATILLDNGADPNVADIDGNTALHYAVLGDMAIVKKLLLCGANMEVKNTDGLTPLSLAQRENKEQMALFLLISGAALPTVNEMESNQQQTSENEEGRRPETSSEKRNLDTDLQESPTKSSRKTNSRTVESSEEDSLRSNPGLDNSRDLSDDKDCKDEVISKTYILTAKASENQSKQIHLPPMYQEKKSQESEMNRACDREDISEQSGHSSVQNYDKKRSKQERLEEKKKLKLAREELKQKCHEFRVKFKYVSDEETKPPNVVPSHSRTWSSEDDSTWSSNSEVCLGEKTLHSENDHKPDTEHVLNKKEESFCDETKDKKIRNPVVSFEVKEDQEFDMQMTENMNPNTTNWKLGIGHTPQSSDPKSHLDLRLAHGNETKHMIPIKSQDASALTSTCKETKPNQNSFQKPLNGHNYNASICKSMEFNLEDWSSSSPCSDKTPEVHANEKVQQDMQRVRNNTDMCRAELLALSKEKVQLQKEDKLTPLSLAKRENQEQTVEFSVKAEASTLAVDEMESNPGLDNSWDLSDDEDGKDEVISKTYILTAKASENQSKQIHLPPMYQEKKSQESEMNRACDREDISEQSGHSSVQNYDKKRSKQERLEEKKKLKLAREELKQKCHEFRVKFKYVSDEETKPPNVVPSHSRTWSSEDDSTWSSNSEVCLGEKTLHSENDHKPDTEHVLNKKEESFCDETKDKKIRNPVVSFEVKEDQEFDMQMTENMNPNTTNWKLGIGHTPQSSDLKSHLDLRLAHGNETKHMIPIKSQDASALTSTCKETKPNQDSFQKPLNGHNYNASICKSMESNLEDWSSSSPYNDGTPEVHANEKLQQDMQRVQSNADMRRAELLTLSKEKVQLQKEDKLTPLSLAQSENQEQTVEFSVKAEASTLAMDEMESNPGLDNSRDLSDDEDCKVSDHYENKEYLLHENHMLKDENAKLRLGKGTVKNQNQQMEKKHFENIKIVKEKNDHLHKKIKHNEEIITETIFQHNGQLSVPTAEITMLNLKLENEKRNRERLETEAESCKSRLATAIQDYEQCQASQRDLQLAFKRERDEWFCLQNIMNFNMSNLKDINESLCQELSEAESKFSSLEIELNHTRDDLRERTLVLEGVQRDLSQTQCEKKEMEHMYQKEQDKLHKYVVKQRSLQEKLSHLQSKNKLLRQQLDNAHNKADDKQKTVINTQDQFQDIIKALQTENEKQALMLNERNKELTNKCNHLKEIIYQYENDKAETDAFVSQLQQELADALRKQSVLEASLEVTSCDHMSLEDETQDLTKKLNENRSQVEEENKKAKTHKKEVEGNIYYVAAADSDGFIQQTKSTQTDNQQYPMENEYSDRFILKEDKEKRQKSDLLYEEEMEQLKNKQYTKEVEINPQLETTVRTQEMKMKIISESYEKEYLLRENHMLKNENAKLRLEIDTVKNQNQEMEKKYCEDIKIIIEKNDHLNQTIQLTEGILKETILEHNEQLGALIVEKALLNFDLGNEKENRERLETEVESYKSKLATAIQDHEQCQASQRDLQLAFKRERDKWFRLRGKMNFDMSNLKDNNESLCQELSKAESKFSSLEIELNHTRDDLRERTLVLEDVQGDLSQTQGQKKEMERMYQKEQDELHKYVGKQGSLEEKLSHLQNENMLLRQQLDAAHNKADDKAMTTIDIQDQLQDIIKILQTKCEKQGLMLNERNNECSNLHERIYQYENDKAERDAVVAQLQQELADALKKQSSLEASLDVTSRHCVNLENETQDLKRKLDENKSQLFQYQDENEKLKKCVLSELTLKYNLGQEIKKNDELKEEVTRLMKLLEVKQSKLTEQANEEFTFLRHLKPNQTKMDVQIDDLTVKLEAASYKCLLLDEENKFLQQELLSLKAIQEKCEKLENENQKWKQEVVNLKRHMQMNMVEFSEVQQYQWTIEKRIRRYRQEVLEEDDIFIQTQTLSQACLDPLRESHNTSTTLLELRVKELEFELSRMKMSQDYTLEKYKQLHLDEIEGRKSLTMKLNKTNEQLADVRMELLRKEEENRFLHRSLKHDASPRHAWC